MSSRTVEKIPLRIDGEEIVYVECIERSEPGFVVICASGRVYFFDHLSGGYYSIGERVFPVKYNDDYFTYSESLGSRKESLQIKTYNNYVAVVQKYGTMGVVFDIENSQFSKELKRGDYCVEHCSFPIAFYSDSNSTFLIHGTDWNRLDITLLEKDVMLTERKVDYETKSNYFDYFHSSLSMSPDSKHFTSNGWFWGPYDAITVYSVTDFLSRFELANSVVNFERVDGYNWDRPMCWVDDRTIAVGYNKKEDHEGAENFPSEIIYVDVVSNAVTKRVTFDGFALSEYGAVQGDLYFDAENALFIGLNHRSGLLVADLEGKPLFANKACVLDKYSVEHRFLYRMNKEEECLAITSIADQLRAPRGTD